MSSQTSPPGSLLPSSPPPSGPRPSPPITVIVAVACLGALGTLRVADAVIGLPGVRNVFGLFSAALALLVGCALLLLAFSTFRGGNGARKAAGPSCALLLTCGAPLGDLTAGNAVASVIVFSVVALLSGAAVVLLWVPASSTFFRRTQARDGTRPPARRPRRRPATVTAAAASLVAVAVAFLGLALWLAYSLRYTDALDDWLAGSASAAEGGSAGAATAGLAVLLWVLAIILSSVGGLVLVVVALLVLRGHESARIGACVLLGLFLCLGLVHALHQGPQSRFDAVAWPWVALAAVSSPTLALLASRSSNRFFRPAAQPPRTGH